MKNIIRVKLCLLIMILGFSLGCEPDVPASHAEIELPAPKETEHSTLIADDIIGVPSSTLWYKTFEVTPAMCGVRLVGWCQAYGGSRNDIKILVLNEVDFKNWRNFQEVEGLYQSGKTSVTSIDVGIESPGKYYLILSNWFSEFSSKKVLTKFYLYWSVKPVTVRLGAENGQLDENEILIPAGANVTIEFSSNDNVSHRLEVYEDAPARVSIPVEDNKFIAPLKGTYIFECLEHPQVETGKFVIVPSDPVIGRELTLKSNTFNSPPQLDMIGNWDVKIGEELILIISASDPDDDTLIYCACNRPDGAIFDPEKREFRWTPERGKARKINHVHFEVSDGVLTDSEDIIITVRDDEGSA